MLVLGSNVDDDAAAHPNMAWCSQLVNNTNSNLMFMNTRLVLLIYTRAATVIFSSTFDNESWFSSALMLLGWPKLPDEPA